MASNINPMNINGAFPIAGQDNDSQGFRDNFTNIRTNLTFTKSEIEDLQAKVVLKSPLSGATTVNNDFAGTQMTGAHTKGFTETYVDQLQKSGSTTVSFNTADMQKITTNGPLTIVLADWPNTGLYAKMRVWLNVTSATHLITFPASVTIGTDKITGFSSQVLTPKVGNYLLELSTVDGGITVLVVPLITPSDVV